MKSFEPIRWIMAADHTPFLMQQARTIRLRWFRWQSASYFVVGVWIFAISSIKPAAIEPRKATIGKGDRFKNGKIPPQGVGSRPNARDSELGSIMNPDEINSAIQGLVNEYGIPTFDVPNATAEGSGGKGGMTGKVDPNAVPRLLHRRRSRQRTWRPR